MVVSVIDNRSFLVLQHAFFSENTIHILVWHEDDGPAGLNALEDNLRVITVRQHFA